MWLAYPHMCDNTRKYEPICTWIGRNKRTIAGTWQLKTGVAWAKPREVQNI